MLDMLSSGGFINRDVHVGICPDMDPKKSHGSITVKRPGGAVEIVHFTVDRPNILKRPTLNVISDMYEQFKCLGFLPEAIEVRLGKQVNVYETAGAVH
ncbi:hypothetical protein [Paraburkholderia sp. BCC1886]|uniref:hypothetical protein n=1 Tax=Paraburkholderia sp. BCC1886 TaxID=2562670 RepID=UPI0011826904|nr:hypothetical protein [Paraburkholderia sp. BCC1886]